MTMIRTLFAGRVCLVSKNHTNENWRGFLRTKAQSLNLYQSALKNVGLFWYFSVEYLINTVQ